MRFETGERVTHQIHGSGTIVERKAHAVYLVKYDRDPKDSWSCMENPTISVAGYLQPLDSPEAQRA